MDNVLIALGAISALGGLAWLAYVGSVKRGSKGNALVGGISAAVIGGALIVLGASISNEPDQPQRFLADAGARPTPTSLPESTPEPTAIVDPVQEYVTMAGDIAARASDDLTRVIQLLRSPQIDSPIWESEVRQLSSGFGRYRARARELAAPPGWTDVQSQLVTLTSDLAGAGSDVVSSFDAVGLGNTNSAQTFLREAIVTMTKTSDGLENIVSQTAAAGG